MSKGEMEKEFDKLSDNEKERRQKSSIKWYQGVLALSGGNEFYNNNKVAAVVRQGNKPYIGGIFQYVYDAKTKDKLKYWDKFPIVIPIEFYDDGFIGLNLHYMPPKMRIKILDKLMAYKKTIKTGSNGRRVYMQLSYIMLKGLYHIPGFDFMIKRYLYKHIRSKIMNVNSEYWREVAYLPTQQFQKASEETVWSDVMHHIRQEKKRRKK